MNYEIRAMSFAEILDTALRLVSNHFVLLVGLMAIANVPTALVAGYIAPAVPQAGEQVSPDEAMQMMTAAGGSFLVTILMLSILYPIAFAATTYAIGESYRGRDVGFGEALQKGTSNLIALIGTSILVTLFIGLGLLCLIIPGIYLSVAFIAVWPIMIVERRFGMEAINRSRALMSGNLMRALGVYVVAGLIGAVLGGAAQLAVGSIPVVGTIGSPLVQSAVGAYTAAAQMVLYFEVRCRKEGFDLEHLAGLVEQQGSVNASL